MRSSDRPSDNDPAGDRTWRQSAVGRAQWFLAPLVVGLSVAAFVTTYDTRAPLLLSLFWAGYGIGLGGALVLTLCTVHRVTLHGDGTRELARPIGTRRVPVEEVRAIRISTDEDGRVTAIRLRTERGDVPLPAPAPRAARPGRRTARAQPADRAAEPVNA